MLVKPYKATIDGKKLIVLCMNGETEKELLESLKLKFAGSEVILGE